MIKVQIPFDVWGRVGFDLLFFPQLQKFCQLNKSAEYLSRDALHKIRSAGVARKVVGLIIEGEAFDGGCASPWKVSSNNKTCGKSPALHTLQDWKKT